MKLRDKIKANLQVGGAKQKRVRNSLLLVVALLAFIILISLVHASTYQPTGINGVPISDANPNFNGTDNTPTSFGSYISYNNTDGQSTALEQPLSKENAIAIIANSYFDPSSQLSGNYSIGHLGGAENGSSNNGTQSTHTVVNTVTGFIELDRNIYYDVGSAMNWSVWLKSSGGCGLAGADVAYNVTSGYYNSTSGNWIWDAGSCATYSCNTNNVFERATTGNQVINSAWHAQALSNEITQYGVSIKVDASGACATNPAGTQAQTNASAKNNTIKSRYTWMQSTDNGVTFQNISASSAWNFTMIKSGQVNFFPTNLTAPNSSDIDQYALFIEVNGSDSNYNVPDVFNVTTNSSQSPLNQTQTVFATVNSNYVPSTSAGDMVLWMKGEVGYAGGADAKYYDGTSDSVNVTLLKNNGTAFILQESKFPTLNANGSFNVNFTLPVAAQAGRWKIRTNYNKTKDIFPQQETNFTVNLIANASRTYGFYGENTSASYNLANITNREGQIRVETYFYNNAGNLTINCTLTIQNKTSSESATWNSTGDYCFSNTISPNATGTFFMQNNFSIVQEFGSTNLVGAGATGDGNSTNASQMDVSTNLTVNSTSANFNIYNLGENSTHRGYVYNVRGEPLQGKDVTINLINSSGNIQNSNVSVLLDGNGFFNKTITLGSANSSQNNASGEPYRTRALFSSNNGNSTETTFSVSSLLNVSKIWTDKQQDGTNFPTGTEDNSFFIGADILNVITNVLDIRGNNKTSAMVYSNVTKTDGILEETRNLWNSSTNSFGWDSWYNINVIAPSAQRIVNIYTNDSYGNYGYANKTITYSPSYTGNLNLDLWIIKESGQVLSQSFQGGDNITIYALFTKDGIPTDVANNVSQITIYYGNTSLYVSQANMIYASTGFYKYNFVIENNAVQTSYFARVYGLLSGADQYGSIWYRVSNPYQYQNIFISLSTGSAYYTGDNINITAFISDQNSNPVANTTVNIRVNYPNGTIWANALMSNISGGYYTYTNTLGNATGVYAVTVNSTYSSLNATTIGSFSVSNLTSRVTTLEGLVSTLQSQMSGVQANVSDLRTDITTLNNSLNSINNTVTNNTADINTLKSQVLTLQTDVSSLQANLQALNSTVNSHSQNISQLQGNVTSINSQISVITTNITTLQNNVTDLYARVDQNTINISSLRTDVNSINSQIVTINSSINSLNQSISNLQVNVSNLTSALRSDISHKSEVLAGNPYSAEISVYDSYGNLIDPANISVELIDPVGASTVYSLNLTASKIATGRYNFTYVTSGSNVQGWYTTHATVTKNSTSETRQQWQLIGGPFDVRDIVIGDSTVPSLQVSATLENTGSISQDMTVVWNLTRTDTNTLLDSGADTVLVSASSTRTHTINPSTNYVGEVKITFLGYYSGTEKAGAFKTFTTSQQAAPSANIASAGGGAGAQAITAQAVKEKERIQIIDYHENIKIVSGEKIKQYITIQNTGNNTLHNVKLLISGLPLDFYSITPKVIDLGAGGTQTFTVELTPNKEVKQYLFKFIISSDEGTKEISSILSVEGVTIEEEKAQAAIAVSFYFIRALVILIVLGILVYFVIKKKEAIKGLFEKRYEAKEKVIQNVLNAKNIIIVILALTVLASVFLNISIKDIPSNIVNLLSVIKLSSISFNWAIFVILIVLVFILIILFHLLREIKYLKGILFAKPASGIKEQRIEQIKSDKPEVKDEFITNKGKNNKKEINRESSSPKCKYLMSISDLPGKKVYAVSGSYIGEIKDVILRENKIDSLKIDVDKNLRFDAKGIIVKYRDIENIGEIAVVKDSIIKWLEKNSK